MPTERFHAEIVTMTQDCCGQGCTICRVDSQSHNSWKAWFRDVLNKRTGWYDSENAFGMFEMYESARRDAHIARTMTFWNAAVRDAEIEWRRENPDNAARGETIKSHLSGSSGDSAKTIWLIATIGALCWLYARGFFG